MKFSEQLKEYRKAHNLSQEALAKQLFYSFKSISNWEKDDPTAPPTKQDMVRKLLRDFPDVDT